MRLSAVGCPPIPCLGDLLWVTASQRPADVPYGYCWCRCGGRTSTAPQTHRAKGWVKGEPIRFIAGHQRRIRAEDRFWSNVDKTPGQGGSGRCWIWTGRCHPSQAGFPYGLIWVNGRTQPAHRLSYEMHFGPIPEGMFILHGCDTPQCVNPDCLRAGTPRENSRDMVDRERNSWGEEHACAKLTDEVVEEIRQLALAGQMTQRSIARQFGIAQTHVSRIKRGENRWRPSRSKASA